METLARKFEQAYRVLNKAQRQAVDTIEGPVMVLAGPGTGKTQVLAMRIAKILKETQMDPWNILCLTFTESGVAAMRTRLLQIIGEAAHAVRIYTFHSFCNEVIREWPEVFHRSKEWEVLSDVERIELFQQLIADLPGTSSLKPFGDPQLYLMDVVGGIGRLKQEDITPERYEKILGLTKDFLEAAEDGLLGWFNLKLTDRTEKACQGVRDDLREIGNRLKVSESVWVPIEKIFARWEARLGEAETKREASAGRTKLKNDVKRWYEKAKRHWPRQQELLKIYEKYQEALVNQGRFDYEDMIMSVVENFKVNDSLLAHYQEQFQYILVDEYQDTNGAQNEALRLLGSFAEKPNIFVVGDDKQSIYRFQGASLENLRYFYDLYSQDVKVIALQDNYRSQPLVLRAAAAVIGHNEESIEKYVSEANNSLQAKSGFEARKLVMATLKSEGVEHYWVAREVSQLLKKGTEADQIAVLARYHRDGQAVYEALRRQGLPVVLEAGEDALKDRGILLWLKLVEFLVTNREDLLVEVLQSDWLKLDEVAVWRVLHKAGGRKSGGLVSVLSEEEQWTDLIKKLAMWKRRAVTLPLDRWLSELAHESGYVDFVLEAEDSLWRLKALRALLDVAKELARRGEVSAKEFVRKLKVMRENNLGIEVAPVTTAAAKVKVMTAHRAKGSEFEQVFVVGLNDKNWGNVPERNRLPLPAGVVARDVVGDFEKNEDERRLFYVAMTRAKRGLYLTRSKAPSIFWSEVPAELRQEVTSEETEQEAKDRLRPVVRQERSIREADQERRDFVAGLLSRYVMSVTHLNNYLECPRLFYYRNLLRVPEIKTKHMAFGTAVHKTLRDWWIERQATRRLLDKQWLISRFEQHLERESLSEEERQDSLALGREALAGYYAANKDGVGGDVLLEYDFRSHGVMVGDLVVTGVLDKVEIIDAKKKLARVVDYKTGNPDTAGKKLKAGGDYYRQLVFYKLLADESKRFGYEMTSGVIDFIQPSKSRAKQVRQEITVTKEDVVSLREEIAKTWQGIKNIEFLEAERACGKCGYCQNYSAR